MNNTIPRKVLQWNTELRTSQLRTTKRSDQQIPEFLLNFTYNNVCDSNFGPTSSRRFGQNNGFKMVRGLKFHCIPLPRDMTSHHVTWRHTTLHDVTPREMVRGLKFHCNLNSHHMRQRSSPGPTAKKTWRYVSCIVTPSDPTTHSEKLSFLFTSYSRTFFSRSLSLFLTRLR
jgi:hypothetical protein